MVTVRRFSMLKYWMANYVNNRALLAEIHASKSSYCVFIDPSFAAYDGIVTRLGDISPEVIADALLRRQKAHPGALEADVIIRVMSDQHLPLEEDETVRRRGRRVTDRVRTNFPAFEHMRRQGDAWVVVGRSHWRGDLQTGKFEPHGGRVTRRLAEMWQTMALNYSRRGNWRNYSWVEDMRSQALVQLSQVGLQFDESKGSNVFAFYTTIISNVYKRAINIEHKQLNIRDDLLIMAGATPSFRRQGEDQAEQQGDTQAETRRGD